MALTRAQVPHGRVGGLSAKAPASSVISPRTRTGSRGPCAAINAGRQVSCSRRVDSAIVSVGRLASGARGRRKDGPSRADQGAVTAPGSVRVGSTPRTRSTYTYTPAITPGGRGS